MSAKRVSKVAGSLFKFQKWLKVTSTYRVYPISNQYPMSMNIGFDPTPGASGYAHIFYPYPLSTQVPLERPLTAHDPTMHAQLHHRRRWKWKWR